MTSALPAHSSSAHPALALTRTAAELENTPRAVVRSRYVPLSRGLWLHRSADDDCASRAIAFLSIYPGSTLCGWSAARLHGFDVPGNAVAELNIEGTARRRANLIVRRFQLPERARVERRGVPVTSLRWTAFDLARFLDFREAVLALESLSRQGFDLDDLDETLDLLSGAWGIRRARLARSATDPRSESPMETLTRLTLQDNGIEGFETQVWLPGPRYRLDLANRWAMVAVEYDGEHHRTAAQQGSDARRRNRLVAEGWVVIVVTYSILMNRPQEFIAQVRAALDRPSGAARAAG